MSLAQVQIGAAHILVAVGKGSNLHDVLEHKRNLLADLSVAEKGALQDMAYGCQRYLGSLRFMLGKMLSRPIQDELTEAVLLVALYQLNHTRNAPHAVVNEAVEAMAKLGKGKLRSFSNAILRRFLREKDQLNAQCKYDEVAKFNFPLWWVQYLKQHYPQHWHNIITASHAHPPLTLRVNRRHCDAAHYVDILAQHGLTAKILDDYAVMLNETMPVQKIPYFLEGWVSVQDFGAQQAGYLLQPQDGERILDACAAPGGKTGHLLELAQCEVTALDIDQTRLLRVQSNLDRLQLKAAALHCTQAQDIASWYDGKPFDAILADVPCTASGVVKRNPDIKWLRRPTDARKTAWQQRAMLDALWQLLKPNGRMLLATCSLFTEENGQQLHAFLARHADAQCLTERTLLPNQNQDGFYYALLQKQ